MQMFLPRVLIHHSWVGITTLICEQYHHFFFPLKTWLLLHRATGGNRVVLKAAIIHFLSILLSAKKEPHHQLFLICKKYSKEYWSNILVRIILPPCEGSWETLEENLREQMHWMTRSPNFRMIFFSETVFLFAIKAVKLTQSHRLQRNSGGKIIPQWRLRLQLVSSIINVVPVGSTQRRNNRVGGLTRLPRVNTQPVDFLQRAWSLSGKGVLPLISVYFTFVISSVLGISIHF